MECAVMIEENDISGDDEDRDESADDRRCPICGNLSCEHFVASINKTDGGIEGAEVLWLELNDAVDRAAAGGAINKGKVSKTFDDLLEDARRYGIEQKCSEDASSDLIRDIIYVAAEIMDLPGSDSKNSVECYGGYPAESSVKLFWAIEPEKFAAKVRDLAKAIRLSVGEVPKGT
jgi:hypothetical protein